MVYQQKTSGIMLHKNSEKILTKFSLGIYEELERFHQIVQRLPCRKRYKCVRNVSRRKNEKLLVKVTGNGEAP